MGARPKERSAIKQDGRLRGLTEKMQHHLAYGCSYKGESLAGVSRHRDAFLTTRSVDSLCYGESAYPDFFWSSLEELRECRLIADADRQMQQMM